MSAYGPDPVFEFVLRLYEDERLTWQARKLKGAPHTNDDVKRILTLTAMSIPPERRPA